MYYGFESAAPLVALGGGAVACRAAEAYTSAVGGDYAHYIVLLEGSLNGDNPYGKYADALVAGYGLGSALVYDDGTLGEALAAGDPALYGRGWGSRGYESRTRRLVCGGDTN